MNNKKKTVAVALSGGVDSSATAYILREQGYDVFGITMSLFDDYNVEAAIYAANKLNIKHYVVDFKKQFEEEIINSFIDKYLQGLTPNPCIMCNQKIKYGILLDKAKELGADYIAMGHYAEISCDTVDGMYHLYKGKAQRKDQSYCLYHLNQQQLSSILLPLYNYEDKEKVRQLIKNIMPNVAEQKDSTNICFAGNMNHYSFIRSKVGKIEDKGNFVDKNGKYLGKHRGIYSYTIGQKRGLGLKNQHNLIITDILPKTNEIILGQEEDIYQKSIIVDEVSYIDENLWNVEYFQCEVKLCQWGYFIPCTVYNNRDRTVRVEFQNSERASAAGQSAVMYKGNEVLGGGIICQKEKY